MKRHKRKFLFSIVWGVSLVVIGVVFLFSTLEVISIEWEMVIGPVLAAAGLLFLLVFITDTTEWWMLIPGFVLIGLGINLFTSKNLGLVDRGFGSAIFLGFIGIPFLLIYITNHMHWWALIPGGVMLTLAVLSLLPENSALESGLFFIGLAITFGLVYVLPKPAGKLKWALYPAGILLLLGILMSLGAVNLLGYAAPLALLVVGGYIIYQALRKRNP